MKADYPFSILVDAHVHLHQCFDTFEFVEAASTNFRNAARKWCNVDRFVGVLCLTEGPYERGFERLRLLFENERRINISNLRDWQLFATNEEVSMRLMRRDLDHMIVIAGRQIRTAENLEVLAIGTCEEFEEGQPLKHTLRRVAQAEALPIVPWGFGKWTGKRGNLVQKLVENSASPRFFLGDSGNRPLFVFAPRFFDLAKKRGIVTLPGSDPLPFPSENDRTGSYGFALQGPLNLQEPARDLKDKLMNEFVNIQTYGNKERPLRFIRNQIAMQYKRRGFIDRE